MNPCIEVLDTISKYIGINESNAYTPVTAYESFLFIHLNIQKSFDSDKVDQFLKEYFLNGIMTNNQLMLWSSSVIPFTISYVSKLQKAIVFYDRA